MLVIDLSEGLFGSSFQFEFHNVDVVIGLQD